VRRSSMKVGVGTGNKDAGGKREEIPGRMRLVVVRGGGSLDKHFGETFERSFCC